MIKRTGTTEARTRPAAIYAPAVAETPSTDVAKTVTAAHRPVLVGLLGVILGAALGMALILAFGIAGNPWYHVVKIAGGSMAPTIEPGSLVVVGPAPAQVQPGMVVVMQVGDEVITHRVVAVSANGRLVTKGDANRATDDWGGQPVRVLGRYLASIPLLGAILPVPDVSSALFTDRVAGTTVIRVGVFPIPPVAATVSVALETISLKSTGDITAYVDDLAEPHELSEIDMSSIQLCYQGQCIPSVGQGSIDVNGHVAASFDGAAFATAVGADTGSLLLVVKGKLADGDSFQGTHTAFVISDDSTASNGSGGGAAPSENACAIGMFSYGKLGASSYPMLSVRVWANTPLPAGCSRTFSLDAYERQGPDTASTGALQLLDHASVTLDASQPTGTLTVAQPPCLGRTSFYAGDNVPQPLIAWSDGGQACADGPGDGVPVSTSAPTPAPSASTDPQPSDSPTLTPTATPSPTAASTPAPTAAPTPAPTDAPAPTATASAGG